MRVRIVDPSAYTPPYDHALCAALAEAGADVTLATSKPGLGADAQGYAVEEAFYRGVSGLRAAPLRIAAKLARHVPDMRAEARRPADITHYQWLPVQHLDRALLPRDRPTVLTAHDVLPREPRPGQRAAQRRLYAAVDAVVVHSEHGRQRLIAEAGAQPERVHVIRHGAFAHYRSIAQPKLPPELSDDGRPVALAFGLIRPYKGIDLLLDAWRRAEPDAQLWIVGRPRGATLPDALPPGVQAVQRFVDDAELAGVFARADLAVLPYREIDQSGVLFCALAFGLPLLLSDAGGFPELRGDGAEIVPRGDAGALAGALTDLLADPARRAQLAAQARTAAADTYAWDAIARRTLALYEALQR